MTNDIVGVFEGPFVKIVPMYLLLKKSTHDTSKKRRRRAPRSFDLLSLQVRNVNATSYSYLLWW